MSTFTVYESSRVSGPYGTDHVTEKGCDGVHHAECVCLILEDEDGNQVDGEHLRTRLLGLCDGTCERGKKTNQGRFFLATHCVGTS